MATVRGIVPRKATSIVGIDFGTYASGFSWTIDGGPPRLHSAYPDAPAGVSYPKMLTAILYRNREVAAVGWTARQQYLELQARGEQAAGYKLVTGFKLLLHDANHPGGPELPAGVNEVQAVADFLKELKSYCLRVVRQDLGPGQSHRLAADAITYVVTVPALWSDSAKGKMRDACKRAGLELRDKPESLLMGLEPEAGALWAKHSQAATFAPGEVLMVADGGGGTFDWTVHKCIARGSHVVLEEATCTEGKLLGSTRLDAAFMEHYREEVGAQAFDAWRSAHPHELLQVQAQWERLKCLYGQPGGQQPLQVAGSDFDSDGLRVSIPPALHSVMDADDKSRLAVEYGGDDSITLDDEAMRSLFDPTVDEIIEVTKGQIRQADNAVDKVLLVGGFCSSPYLQRRFRQALQALPNAPQVVLVDTPYAAVLRGAVLFGADPTLIQARRARYSYGVRACGPCDKGAPNRFWHAEEQAFYSDSLFSCFVEQGQSVEYNEEVEYYFVPLYRDQLQCDIDLYMVDGKAVKFIDEDDVNTKKLGHLVVSLSATTQREDRVIRVAFRFGRVEIEVDAVDESTQQPVSCRLRFQHT